MPHRDGCGLDRLIIVVITAQKSNEAGPGILRAECDVAVALKRRFDASAPRGRCDGNAFVSASVK